MCFVWQIMKINQNKKGAVSLKHPAACHITSVNTIFIKPPSLSYFTSMMTVFFFTEDASSIKKLSVDLTSKISLLNIITI